MGGRPQTARTAYRWFWLLLLVGVVAMAGLYTATGARPGPLAGLAVAGSATVLLLATTQATRILLAIERARRRASPGPLPAGRPRPRSLIDRLLGAPDQR